ncbi:hypothetical protein TBK1r_71010 [Stieleria magnilauensis]|uniref:Uncharacterized protein n=1 Tax=Stieleria magnilauensis TaxID=2527963 RepID=A0ABX5Y1F0_9BACT|nr:hypothetical protein TBK1r_71010 [Planctomycetes bacterium TBK1r]
MTDLGLQFAPCRHPDGETGHAELKKLDDPIPATDNMALNLSNGAGEKKVQVWQRTVPGLLGSH